MGCREGFDVAVEETWISQIAGFVRSAYESEIPEVALERATLQLLDSLACAAGAVPFGPPGIIRDAVHARRAPGAAECTLFFEGSKALIEDAILYNGSLVRYLDCNDGFLQGGPGGHPSDNIPVAIAFAEKVGADGPSLLRSIAVGYELFWRLRKGILRSGLEAGLDGVSVSSVVGAAIGGCLMGLGRSQMIEALAIGACQGYALPEIRMGKISMIKAAANAMVARGAVLALELAQRGMTGPEQIFEGAGGLLPLVGIEPSEALLASLVEPVNTWKIVQVSVKPYPAIGTSQSAISAALRLRSEEGLQADAISKIVIRLPDNRGGRRQLEPEARRPTSRESADHSVPFVVALALAQGRVAPSDFGRERKSGDEVTRLLDVVEVVLDRELAAKATQSVPAGVEVQLRDGTVLERTVVATPGSPLAPWGMEELLGKLRALSEGQLSADQINRIAEAVRRLRSARSVGELTEAVSSGG